MLRGLRICFKIYRFTSNCYFIGKVSPLYGFLAGFSSPESIFAEKYLFPVLSPKQEICYFFSKIALFHINCYFIGKVSPLYGFLAGFSSPESIFAEKYLFPVLSPKQEICYFFSKIALFHINCYFIGKVSPLYGFLAGFSSPESIFAEKYLFPVLSPKQEICYFFSKIALFHINCYFIGKVSPLYGFLAGFSSPESIFAEKYLFPVLSPKQEICYFFSKIALFHINCYFIGKVSPLYGFLAGFSSPESIFAEKYLFPVLSPKQEICYFFSKIALFHINCYFIGKVSPLYGFLAGFSSPESIFAEKYLFPVLSPKQEICYFFSKIALFHINCYFIGKVSPLYGFLAGFSSPESIFAEKYLFPVLSPKQEICYFFPKSHYFTSIVTS